MFFKRLSLLVSFFAAMVIAQEPAPAATASTPASGEAFKEAPLQAPSSVEKKDDNSSTISVFVKNPEEIRALQEDLKNLQTMVGDSNPEVAALLKRANRVAEMNDRCASISLNDLLDTTCARFYEVELPAFENEYMEVTGEVRLGSMRMATTLEERTRQLASCSEALTSIIISREQLLRLRGNVYLEPINFNGDFDAEYMFTLSYDPARVEQQQRLANLWIEKCGPIVVRQSGSEFAPMFIATLKVKNDSLKKAGSNVKFMLNKKTLALRIDMRRPVSGAYYLNGVRLFEKTIDADQKQSNLLFDIKNKKAVLNKPKDAEIQKFHGKEVFKKLKKMEMVGRWAWDEEKLPEEVVKAEVHEESEVMTAEDSLTYKQGLAELERALAEENNETAANEASAAEAASDAAGGESKKKSIHWIPFAISGAVLAGGVAVAYVFNKKAKDERDAFADGNTNYEDSKKAVQDYQRNRTIGVSFAIIGAVGVGLSFVF